MLSDPSPVSPTFLRQGEAGRSSVSVGDKTGVNADVILPEATERCFGPAGQLRGSEWIILRDVAWLKPILFISLVAFGLYSQAGRVCYVLVVLGPHELGVGGQVAAFKVQRDDAVIVDVHNYLLSAWEKGEMVENAELTRL